MLFRRALPFVVFAAALSLLAGAGGAQGPKTFVKTKANDPESCAVLWKAIGRPAYVNAAGRENMPVCHSFYFVSHNIKTKTPDWVIERMNKRTGTGKFKRPGENFSPEARVPDEGNPRGGDYANSGFALGHMAPSEDFNISCKAMRESFSYANAVPQVGPRFNSSIWRRLEEEVRETAQARGTLYVITGPIPRDGAGNAPTITAAEGGCGKAVPLDGTSKKLVCKEHNKSGGTCTEGVTVPVALFKIVYEPAKKRAYAFALANKDHPSKTGEEVFEYLDDHRVTVATITRLTGIEFLPDVPERPDIVNKCATERFWARDPATPAPKEKKVVEINCPPVKQSKKK
jgi:endonuclease G